MRSMTWTKRAGSVAAVLAGLALGACGPDAGHQTATLKGTISGLSSSTAPVSPRIVMGWHISLGMFPDNSDHQWSFGESAKLTATSFPAPFTFDALNPPPESAYPKDSSGAEVLVATGLLMVADDVNKDSRFDFDINESGLLKKPDVLLGWAAGEQVIYVRDASHIQKFTQAMPTQLSNPQDLKAGYNLVQGNTVVPLDTAITIGPFANQ